MAPEYVGLAFPSSYKVKNVTECHLVRTDLVSESVVPRVYRDLSGQNTQISRTREVKGELPEVPQSQGNFDQGKSWGTRLTVLTGL